MSRRRKGGAGTNPPRIAWAIAVGAAATGAAAWWMLREPPAGDPSRTGPPAPQRRASPARPLVPPGSPARADADAAREHALAGRSAEAVSALRRAIAMEPGSGALHQALGVALLQSGEPLAARVALENALRLLPGDPDVLFHLGIACRELGLLEESERRLREALQRSATSQAGPSTTRAALGETLVQRAQRGVAVDEARLDEGIEEYRRALEDGAGAFVRRLLGQALLLRGRADEAIAELERAAAADPQDRESLLALARIALDRGELERAEGAARRAAAIAVTRPDGEAHHLLGRTLAARGDDAGAAAALRRSLELEPRRAEALHELAGALRRQGLADEATRVAAAYEAQRGTVESLRDRRRDALSAPDSAVAQHNLGVVLEESGSDDEALRAYQRALALDAGQAASHARLGLLLLRRGAWETARTHLAQAPDDASARHGLAWANARLGRTDEAIAGYEALLGADASATPLRLELAATLAKAGRLAEARAQYERVLQSEPRHAGALHDLGGVLLQAGDAPGAAARFRQVLAIDPSHEGARRWLAVAEQRAAASTGR